MDIRNRRALKAAAGQVLENPTGQPGRLVLIYTGAMALLSLISAAVSFYLNHEISETGGLSGMQLRSILQTVEQVMSLAVMVLPLFWSMGFVFCLLKLTRREQTRDGDLFQGFRVFGPVLRLWLLRSALYMGVAMAAFSLGSTLLCMTPLAAPAYEVLLPYVGENATVEDIYALDEAVMLALTDAMIPVFIGCGVICLAAMLPFAYRLRLSDYFLMDHPREGAIMAMLRSNRAMRSHGWHLAGLDLSFWWFYLAEALVTALSFGNLLLPNAGTGVFFAFYGAGLIAQVVLYRFVLMKVELSYVQFYEALRQAPQTFPASKNEP